MITYILKRLTTKYFSTNAGKERITLKGNTKPVIQEIFKLIYLSNICPGDVRHWLGHLRDNLIKSGYPIKTLLGIVDNYKNLPRQFNESYVRDLRNNKSVSDYITSLFIELSNQKEHGKYKYKEILPQSLSKSELDDLIQQLKYIALCISKQMNPKYNNWWDKEVLSTQVNWDSDNIPSEELLIEIIENILGYPIK